MLDNFFDKNQVNRELTLPMLILSITKTKPEESHMVGFNCLVGRGGVGSITSGLVGGEPVVPEGKEGGTGLELLGLEEELVGTLVFH